GLLAVGTANGAIHLFGGPSVETKLSLPDPESMKVKFLQFSNSTFQLVCLDEKNQLHVWDLSTFGKPKFVASARFDNATSLTLSPSHSHAFIALESGEIRTYDLLCHRKSEYRIPNMWRLYEDKTMAIGWTQLRHRKAPFPIETVVHPRDLNLLFVAYSSKLYSYRLSRVDSSCRRYNLSDLTQRNTLRAYELVTAIAIHPAGHFFAAGYSDGCIAFWAVEDEDQPLFVRTLDATTEPIYKLAWSSFPNSSDPRGGETALTILGEPTGLNVQWLPAFNPSEPPNPAAPQTALHPFMRTAMQTSLLPISDFFYYTPGIAQDFFLVPRNSPHFSGQYDPTAILISIESVGDARVVEAYQFPPPTFLASSAPEEAEPSGSDVVDDLESTLKALNVNDHDPHMLRLPTPLWFGSTGVFQAQLLTLDRDSHALLYQMPRILLTQHRNLTLALQFHDIKSLPKSLPGLTIDLQALLTEAAVVTKTSPSFLEHAAVQTAYLARQSLECAVQLVSGEPESPQPHQFKQAEDDELVVLQHVLTPEDSRFAPYFLLTTGNPVSACAISDVGFLAVAYTEALIIVDMRGPRVIFRRGRDKKKNRMSTTHHPSDSTSIASLTWTISTIEHDPHLHIRLIVGYVSGATEILTVLRDTNSPSWRLDTDTKKVETVAHPITHGTFIFDAKTGLRIRATKEQLAQSMDPAPSETHCILVAAGAKGARSIANITGATIAKTDWGKKTGTVYSVQIVEKMGSHALIAFTDTRDALAYSLPNLEYICTLKVPITDASLSCDDTGDWTAYTVNQASGIIDHASYGTVFDFRRAYTPPDITIPKPTVPSQPQPVSLGPTSLLSSWFRFGQSMTGEQLDTLLGGPDRPIPKETKPLIAAANQPTGSSVAAQQAAGVQSTLYSRLQSAMSERGQMLGDLEDRFNSLEEGSKSMVAQAKRMAAEQSAKSWFGI
ncbi:lethal giant larvae like, C-terminal-domain-containing protein, partial [Mycena galopus ATCC 62051]